MSAKMLDQTLLRRLLRQLKPWTGACITALLVIMAGAALDTAIPLITRHAIDVDITNHDPAGLKRTVLLFFGVALASFVLRFIQQVLTGWIGQNIVLDLRARLYRHVTRLHSAWFDKHPVGQVMTRLTNDVENLNELFTDGLILIFQDLLVLLFIMGALLYMNWKLALVLFAIMPLIFLATFQFKRLVRAAFRRVRALVAELNTFLQENITGMAVVQLYLRQDRNRSRFREINDRLMREHVRTIFYFAVFFPLMEILGSLATALVLWAGAGSVLQGELSFGALVAFVHYAERFFRPIRDLSERYNILQGAMASAERVFETLDEEAAIVSADKAQPPVIHGRPGSIEFRGVWFAYEAENWVLRDLSFQVPAGNSAALVGYTGAGKSSIASLLLRFYEFQRGEILVDGLDIRQWPLQDLRKRIAIVLQDVFLFSGSIADNIRLGSSLEEQELEDAARRTGLYDHVRARPEGFDEQVGERGQNLSVGQRQLISFSRALAEDPAILILDEATSSVDTLSEQRIQRATAELMEGRTALVIAHRLSTIQRADQILVMHHGKLVEHGRHEELLANEGVYHRLWQLESRRGVTG